jgi:hypothetical protein
MIAEIAVGGKFLFEGLPPENLGATGLGIPVRANS